LTTRPAARFRLEVAAACLLLIGALPLPSRAQDWHAAIKAGQTFTEIADGTGSSRRRIQHMIRLAFLAPDIVEEILRGEQPPGLTSHWLKTHELPACWEAQRQLIATL